MKRKRVVQGLVGLVFIAMMLAVPLAVLADRIATGPKVPVLAGRVRLDLGEVCANSTVTGTTLVAIERDRGTAGFVDDDIVIVSVPIVSGTGLSAKIEEQDTITLPNDWSSRPNGTVSAGHVISTVTLETGAPGTSFSGVVFYSADLGLTSVFGNMGVRATVVACPNVSITTPADKAVYLRGQVVYADYACSVEEGAPVLDSCLGTVANGDPIDTDTVGELTFVVTATNVANNVTSVTRKYSVIAPDPGAYLFAGFSRPVAEGWNVARAGAAIPMRFSLGGYWDMDVLASVVSVPIACRPSTALNEVNVEAALTPGQSSLSYDAESDQYNYVWKTQRDWAGSCRAFELTLDDGSTHTAEFAFR